MLMKNKPYIPHDTCPHINRVQEMVQELAYINNETLINKQLDSINSELEYIRESNQMLRTASKFWYDIYKNRKERKKRKNNSLFS